MKKSKKSKPGRDTRKGKPTPVKEEYKPDYSKWQEQKKWWPVGRRYPIDKSGLWPVWLVLAPCGHYYYMDNFEEIVCKECQKQEQ